MLLVDVPLHGHEEDVQGLANVLAVVEAENVEQIIQNVFQHRRSEKKIVQNVPKYGSYQN